MDFPELLTKIATVGPDYALLFAAGVLWREISAIKERLTRLEAERG